MSGCEKLVAMNFNLGNLVSGHAMLNALRCFCPVCSFPRVVKTGRGGGRIHPHPGMPPMPSATQVAAPLGWLTARPPSTIEAERMLAAAVEAERLRLAAVKARLLQRQAERLAAKRQQLRRTEAAPLRPAAASGAPP